MKNTIFILGLTVSLLNYAQAENGSSIGRDWQNVKKIKEILNNADLESNPKCAIHLEENVLDGIRVLLKLGGEYTPYSVPVYGYDQDPIVIVRGNKVTASSNGDGPTASIELTVDELDHELKVVAKYGEQGFEEQFKCALGLKPKAAASK